MKHPSPDQIAYMQAHGDDNRQPWLIGTNIAFLVITFIAVALRFIARVKIGTHLGLDDWLIFSAAVSGNFCLLNGWRERVGSRCIRFFNLPRANIVVVVESHPEMVTNCRPALRPSHLSLLRLSKRAILIRTRCAYLDMYRVSSLPQPEMAWGDILYMRRIRRASP
jgi:hypothetical protein